MGECVFPQQDQIHDEYVLQALRFIRKAPDRQKVYMIGNMTGLNLEKTTPLLQELLDKGYIMQDTTDTTEPFDFHSRYYTVSEKRALIDKILQQDKDSSIVSIDEVDCENAELDDLIPLCMSCFAIHKEGKTFCRECGRTLDLIDANILDIVLKLNNKGYPTLHSCSGHYESPKSYIAINAIIDNNFKPEGYAFDAQRDNKTTIRSLPLKKQSEPADVNQVEAHIKGNMNNLRSWVAKLPNLK